MKKIIFILFLSSLTNAQDSLYLVNKLTGTTDNRLTSAKRAGDLNGDGFADLAVKFDDSTRIYFGNKDFELEPDLTVFGAFSFPGDVNQDGNADFIVAKETDLYDYKTYDIYLVFGGTNIDTSGQLLYKQQYIDELFSAYNEPLGDVNGDGYCDFSISEYYNWSNEKGKVLIYFGGDTIMPESKIILTSNRVDDFYGYAVSGIGDQNNDGFDDFLVSAPNEPIIDSTLSRVYLYFGGLEIDTTAARIFNDFPIKGFGEYIKYARDINSDNNIDFFIIGTPIAFLYFSIDSFLEIDMSKYGGGYICCGSGGDINNDGFDDFLLGNTNYKNANDIMVGISELYWGSSIIDTISDFNFEGQYKWEEFSKDQDIIGDFNGDGFDDFFIISPKFPDYSQPCGELYLYSYTKHSALNNPHKLATNSFQLLPNYPNPFNSTTRIPLQLNTAANIEVNIYDIQGRLIKSLFKGKKSAGKHMFNWNGLSDNFKFVSSGIYILSVKISNKNILQSKSHKLILLR